MKVRSATRWIVCGAFAASILVFLTPRSSVAIDKNANGMSDIWELLFPTATNPAADTDGDGVSNLEESIWGTNPLVPDHPNPGFTSVNLNPGTGMQVYRGE